MIIIDIGARDGLASAIPYSQELSTTVYAIEPNPQLVECLKAHHRPNLHVFCMTCGERDDGHVTRLDTFIREQGLVDIELLKIDAQKANLQILKGTGATLNKIHKIHLKVEPKPSNQSDKTNQEILEYLSDRGFRLIRTSQPIPGFAKHLEFIRVTRYPLTQPEADYFEVDVPHLGLLKTPKNDLVGQLLEQGSFEGVEQAFFWLYLRSGDIFFDCGTHAGLFSCIAAKCLETHGKIFGFDPNPICLNLYEQNLNRLGNCPFTALNVGLSAQDGVDLLRLGKPGMSAFSTFASNVTDQAEIGTETIQVTLRSLDSVLSEFQIPHVTLAKLDVEGWENFVLLGAQQSIAAGKFPVWMIEFTEANAVAVGSSTQKLRSLIEQFGYTLCRFDANTFQLVPEPPRSVYPYLNLFAVMDLEAANQRLRSADSEAVAIATDVIVRYETADQRDRLSRELAHLQTIHEQIVLHNLPQLKQELEQVQQRVQELEQINGDLTAEVTHLSTGRAALRALIQRSLHKLGWK